jgi:hypothetical protein
MSETINLLGELSDRNPRPYPAIMGACIYHDQTPAHQFTTVVAPIPEGEYFVALPSRDYFDERLATSVLAFVLNRAQTLSVQKTLTIIEGFSCDEYLFDCVAVLNPSAANQYEYESDLLNRNMFVAFPIYRCELSGDESKDLIDLIRHDFLPTLDWKRHPRPKVLMSFQNAKTKIRSTEERPRLATLQNVLSEIGNLFGAERSWIILENYKGQRCRIAWMKDAYNVELPDQETNRANKTALIDLIRRFLCPQFG